MGEPDQIRDILANLLKALESNQVTEIEMKANPVYKNNGQDKPRLLADVLGMIRPD